MTTRYFGERITRNEDPRLLTGQAIFIDDIDLPGMLHIAFLRSPLAHARIKSIDTSRAASRERVVAVYTAHDMGEAWKPSPEEISAIASSLLRLRCAPLRMLLAMTHASDYCLLTTDYWSSI